MFDGVTYLIVQIALLLVVALVVGFLLGHLLWPRSDDSGVAPDHDLQAARRRVADLQQLLDQAREQSDHLHGRLVGAEAEVLRLKEHVQTLADEKETEMGRLESGAIAALESTINKHQQWATGVEQRLHAAEQEVRAAEELLDSERRRAAQLQQALAERDQHLAALSAHQSGDSRPARPAAPPGPQWGETPRA
jgi:chromosome segregation ATPase